MSNNNTNKVVVKKLAFCAVCIAMAAVASLLKLFTFPFGGEITFFSMLFITLPAWFYGVKEGAICGLAFGLLQFAFSPYIISIPQFILDYIFAFTVMGVAGFFSKSKSGLLKGYIAAVISRWIIATLAGLAWVAAGYTAWDNWNPIPYSMVYNGVYIFTEAIITVIVIILPPVKKALEYGKRQSSL